MAECMLGPVEMFQQHLTPVPQPQEAVGNGKRKESACQRVLPGGGVSDHVSKLRAVVEKPARRAAPDQPRISRHWAGSEVRTIEFAQALCSIGVLLHGPAR